jgi:inner membrane protein
VDPLCHTLAGLALARSGLERRTPLATAALVVGANLPDVDAVTYFIDSDLSLHLRRGLTHGLPAVALWPWLLTGLLLAWDVWRRRAQGRAPARPAALLGLSYLAVGSHPALDWLNTYGMRWLMPFDGSWFYGDSVYIVDPWLWLLLGAVAFLAGRPSRGSSVRWGLAAALALWFLWTSGRPMARPALLVWTLALGALAAGALLLPRLRARPAWARGGLVLALLYVGLLLGFSRAGRAVALRELPRLGIEPTAEGLMVGPRPANPLAWEVVARTPEGYRWGRLTWTPKPRLQMTEGQLLRVETSGVARAALATAQVRGLRTWGRFLWFEAEPTASGWLVFLADARYVRQAGSTGFAGARVELDRDLRPVGGR